ncbi:MAG: ATP-dependent helicase [Oscillospiraceae bacterium]|nr:ATP-dependent helicase [Oscillospiraceae bacterium]
MPQFNEFQIQAIHSDKKQILVVAAPGSGKTTVLVNRILDLVSTKKINPYEIVVITFTKKAALNMEERFKKLYSSEVLPFFGTFHSFCYRILLSEGYTIKIISESEKYDLFKKFVYELTGKVMPKSKHINKDLYKNEIIMKRYVDYKKENSLFDFDDLEDEVIKLLGTESIRIKYNSKYHHILVDEFQDCNDKQIYILKKFSESSIFCVGDEDQCIYTFRGSNPEYMVTFCDHFKEGIKLDLPVNYRCPKNIVLMSKNLIKYNKKRNDKDINYFRETDGEINLLDHENEDNAHASLLKSLQSLKCENTCGVLVRTNKEIIPILFSLFKKNIAACVRDGLSFLDFKTIKDLENLIKLSMNFNNKDAFLELTPYISKIEKQSILKQGDLFNYCRRFSLYKRRRVLILKIITLILRFSDKMSVMKIFKYFPYYNKIIDFKEIDSIIEDLNLNDYNLNDILNHLKYLENSLYNKNSNITISTIHGIKGMEFDEVHILNACEGFLPITTKDSNIEEERRIFYIAITRTREKLTIHHIKYYLEKEREKSRFLKELYDNINVI